jgi:hypothetical protein
MLMSDLLSLPALRLLSARLGLRHAAAVHLGHNGNRKCYHEHKYGKNRHYLFHSVHPFHRF